MVLCARYPDLNLVEDKRPSSRGVGRNLSRGVVLNVIFQKGYFCTDRFTNTLHRKCIKIAPKKGGSDDPPDTPPQPPFPTPLSSTNAVYHRVNSFFHCYFFNFHVLDELLNVCASVEETFRM